MASRLASALERAVVTAISDELRRLDSVDDSRSAISVVQGDFAPSDLSVQSRWHLIVLCGIIGQYANHNYLLLL